MAVRQPLPEPQQSSWGSIAAIAALAGGLAIGWWTCAHAPSSGLLPGQPLGSASAPLPSASSAAEAPRPPARCVDVAESAFVIGEAPAPKPAPAPTQEASPIPAPEEPDEQLAPFAVEIGRGAVFEGGFGAGVLRDAEGGTLAMIATLGFDGKNGKLVKLSRSRGDLEPPVVTGAGPAMLTAMLEPNAGGRAIKIAKVRGEEVTWGAELAEGRDESLALDIATSGARAVIVWDDVPKDAKRSSVLLASFDTETLRSVTRARPVSPPSTDADSPRVIARPGGYWLAYAARAEEPEPAAADEPKRKKKGKAKDDEDTAAAGEAIASRWVELIPLDEAGSPTATPRAVTPKDGHVLAFDLELGEGGAALVAYRDDDTPSGSSGGRVSSVLISPGGGDSEPHLLAEEGVGVGVPELLPGWISIGSISGPTRLGTITEKGELVGALSPEASLGVGGEPIASARGALLIARPAGKSMRLSVMKCAPGAPGALEAPAAPLPAGAGGAGAAEPRPPSSAQP